MTNKKATCSCGKQISLKMNGNFVSAHEKMHRENFENNKEETLHTVQFPEGYWTPTVVKLEIRNGKLWFPAGMYMFN